MEINSSILNQKYYKKKCFYFELVKGSIKSFSFFMNGKGLIIPSTFWDVFVRILKLLWIFWNYFLLTFFNITNKNLTIKYWVVHFVPNFSEKLFLSIWMEKLNWIKETFIWRYFINFISVELLYKIYFLIFELDKR